MVSTKMDVFWFVVLRSLVEVYWGFTGACSLPDDGDSKQFCNNGKLLPDYIMQQPRRQPPLTI
jgi:hypothetical protein